MCSRTNKLLDTLSFEWGKSERQVARLAKTKMHKKRLAMWLA